MRRTMTRRSFVGGAIATAVTVVGCQNQSPQAGTQPQAGGRNAVVNLYSARHYDSDQAIYQQFTQETGIQVNLIEAEADALIERLKSEGTNSPADVLITVDAGRLWRAEQAGMFQPIDSDALKQVIPAHLHHPNNLWFGFSKRARPILYNKDQVNPTELSTYEDLANEKWRGQILIRSSTNVYNQSLVGSLIAANGEAQTEAWARGLVANFARPPEGNDTAQILACAAGAGKLAIANSYYLVRMAKSSQAEEKAAAAKIGVFYPNQSDRGTHINISGGGIVKTSPNPEAALKFLNFLASPTAQDIFAKSNNEYSVIKGVPLDATLASYGEFKEDMLNAAVYGEKGEAALQLMDRVNWT